MVLTETPRLFRELQEKMMPYQEKPSRLSRKSTLFGGLVAVLFVMLLLSAAAPVQAQLPAPAVPSGATGLSSPIPTLFNLSL